ncbi:hypothetical protein LAE38_005093 [Escherichia coli]|nr:hypothetical protein [Escherichia coli]
MPIDPLTSSKCSSDAGLHLTVELIRAGKISSPPEAASSFITIRDMLKQHCASSSTYLDIAQELTAELIGAGDISSPSDAANSLVTICNTLKSSSNKPGPRPDSKEK